MSSGERQRTSKSLWLLHGALAECKRVVELTCRRREVRQNLRFAPVLPHSLDDDLLVKASANSGSR